MQMESEYRQVYNKQGRWKIIVSECFKYFLSEGGETDQNAVARMDSH